MKIQSLLLFLSIICGCSVDAPPDGESQYQNVSPDGIPFTIASTPWDVESRGNHRAVVSVEKTNENAVIVTLPWRRADMRPDTKRIVVVDSRTNKEIGNVSVLNFTSEEGKIAFQPLTVPGEYYIYYLPYKFRKKWDDARYGKPWNDYLAPEYATNAEWERSVKENQTRLPVARVIRFESRNKFDYFTCMGLAATQNEMEKLQKQYSAADFLVFPEDRAFPSRLVNVLPVRWIEKGPTSTFKGYGSKNEYYTWQLGVWAMKKEVENVHVKFSDFVHESGKSRIEQKDITCFNQEGINWDGKPVSFTVNIPYMKLQSLWCGAQIPEDAKPGDYKGKVTICADGMTSQVIDVTIHVDNNFLADHGDGDLWRHARLRWLNSTIGDDDLPVIPYQAMELQDKVIRATGKKVTLGENGLPVSIEINERQLLVKPISFLIETNKGTIPFSARNVKIEKKADGLVSWKSSFEQNGIAFSCSAYMEYDGYIRYNLKVASQENIAVNNIKLVTTYKPGSSVYFMGTGYKGGDRPESYTWNWKGPWDSYWIGGALSGLHVEFRGGSYHGPLINDYKPAPPAVWSNEGKGGITLVGNKGQDAVFTAYTGAQILSSKPLDFEFALLITPVKPVNPSKHFSERYYHAAPQQFAKAALDGANIANIHHAQPLNPVINYPFIVRDSLIQYIEEQHKANRKVKLYYTIRELTNHTVEIYALKSLNHEIFVKGVGYGTPWQCEHLIDDYKPAWYTELPEQNADAALVLNGFSRWINYYLEGLRWMLENYKIDGIYMDDVSFDRTVMKRMRKIMSKYRPGALIDLHSNTGYSIGPANQYTDFFPYVDRLWFGESFKYNQMMPDEWFVTFSGIPFGQMSEMLQDGGNRFLGMVYGATARHSYGSYSPVPVWKLWKSFGITDAEMVGYWNEECPVTTNLPNVKATAYIKKGKTLIAIGNFDSKDAVVRLKFNWEKLRLSPDRTKVEIPEIENFQSAKDYMKDDTLFIKSKEGRLLILSDK